MVDMLLGELDRVVSVGELIFIWSRGVVDNQLCGCGESFDSCGTWNDILIEYDRRKRRLSENEYLVYRNIGSMLRFPALLFGVNTGRKKDIVKSIISSYDELYRSISKVTDAEIIVDSSKAVPFAYLLLRYSNLRIKLIHVVRDSRAVTFSRQKRKIRKEIVDRVEYMPTVSTLRSALKWMVNNISTELVARRHDYVRITYEGLAANPTETLGYLASYMGRTTGEFLKILSGTSDVLMSAHHTISGNPSRFDRGMVEIRCDDRWRKEMKSWKKLLVTFVTWPLLWRYYH